MIEIQEETDSPKRLQQLIVPANHQGLRIDQSLKQLLPDLSRTEIQRLIDEGLVFLDKKLPKKRSLLMGGETISLTLHPKALPNLIPEPMFFDILYEDEEIFVINKPAGLVVHPGPGNYSGTFVHGLLAHCHNFQCHDHIRPGIVHRLDKETSGVLLAAKTPYALHVLSQQFQDRTVEKQYKAIVLGHFQEEIQVDQPIGRDHQNRKKMAIVSTGKSAITIFRTISTSKNLSFIEAIPLTGRTHQIRVHLAFLHFPVVGDHLYGKKNQQTPSIVKRHMLHCHRLVFRHPTKGTRVEIEGRIPPDMELCLQMTGLSS